MLYIGTRVICQINAYRALSVNKMFQILNCNTLLGSTTLCPYEDLPGGFKAQDLLSLSETYKCLLQY